MGICNTTCKSICQTIYDITDKQKDLVFLALRLVVGIIFLQAGYYKLMDLERTAVLFGDLGIPMPMINAVLASVTEFVGGILLIIGLGTRLISLPLAFVMVVAIITAKLGNVESFSDFIRLQELDYLLIFLLFACTGAGKYSVDQKCCCK